MTLQTLQSEKQQLSEDDQEMIKQRAKLEFDVKDLEENLVEDGKSKVPCSANLDTIVVGKRDYCIVVVMLWFVMTQESCQKELATLEKTVQVRQGELDALLPRYMQQKTEEEQLNIRSVGLATMSIGGRCGDIPVINDSGIIGPLLIWSVQIEGM